MSIGIFTNIAQSYLKAAKNNWAYVSRTRLLLKPLALPFAVPYSILLLIIAVIFYLGIILDWLGRLTDILRKNIIKAMKHLSCFIDTNLWTFLVYPVLLIVFAPILIISLFIPKLSSDLAESFAVDQASDLLNGSGAFKQVKSIFWEAATRMFDYVASTYLILKPFTGLIAIINSIILMIIGFCFTLLIPLDWLSYLVECVRLKIARTAYNLQNSVHRDFSHFLFVSPLLIVLAPIFLVLLIIPKMTSQLSDT